MKTLNYYIAAYKLSHEISSSEQDQKLLQWAIDCLKWCRAKKMMDFAQKWAHIDIQTTGNGEKWGYLPRDYRRYLWVGSCQNRNGEGLGGNFISYDLNNDLCDIPPWECCACDGDMNQATVQSCCNGGGGEFDGGLYWGYGGGEPYSYSYSMGSYAIGPTNIKGTFKIDTANNIIRFDKCVNKCVIKYEGDFLSNIGNCFVPSGLEDNGCIGHWMEWCMKRFSPDANLKREAMGEYNLFFSSIRDYNSQRNALNRDEWLTLIRRFTYLGVKS